MERMYVPLPQRHLDFHLGILVAQHVDRVDFHLARLEAHLFSLPGQVVARWPVTLAAE